MMRKPDYTHADLHGTSIPRCAWVIIARIMPFETCRSLGYGKYLTRSYCHMVERAGYDATSETQVWYKLFNIIVDLLYSCQGLGLQCDFFSPNPRSISVHVWIRKHAWPHNACA